MVPNRLSNKHNYVFQSQSEEKKGVIYAELALGDQTSADKPPPPSTEYAEIVYTDQPGQKEVKE